MGETRRRERGEDAASDVTAAPLETQEDLSALELAGAVLDQEVDRLARIVGAQQEVHKLTTQIRAAVATAQPLLAKKTLLEAEIARHEAQLTALQARVEEVHTLVREAEADLSTLHEQIRVAQRLRDELTALR